MSDMVNMFAYGNYIIILMVLSIIYKYTNIKRKTLTNVQRLSWCIIKIA